MHHRRARTYQQITAKLRCRHGAPHVEHASIAEAAESSEDEDEDEATAALVGGKSLWTARIRGEPGPARGPLELSVDTRYLQFFDPGSGLSVGHPKATALGD